MRCHHLCTLCGSDLIITIVVKSSPEHKQSLSTLVDPQSGRSSHRGGKLFPVWAVSFLLVMVIGDGSVDGDGDDYGDDGGDVTMAMFCYLGIGFIAHADPLGTVPSVTYVPLK